MPTEIDPDKFEEIQSSDETWVIDFWAEWCGPCKQYSPVFEEVSEKMDDVNFGKVDMEEHQNLGTSLGVRALPTTLVLKGDEEVARSSGAMNKDDLVDFVEENA